MTDEPWRWLASTRELQERNFQVDYPNLTGDALADYVSYNALALVDEVSEALDEIRWKPWATPRGDVDRRLFLKELVDAAHFLGNLACSVGCTDEEWQALYQAKQQVNRDRQAAGYDGVTGKCPLCRKSYDDEVGCQPEHLLDPPEDELEAERLFETREAVMSAWCETERRYVS